MPGGAVRSAEVTAPGYLSDLYSSFYPLGYASPVLAGLDLPGYGLTWTHAPDVLAHLLPDGRAAVINRDLDAHRRLAGDVRPRRRGPLAARVRRLGAGLRTDARRLTTPVPAGARRARPAAPATGRRCAATGPPAGPAGAQARRRAVRRRGRPGAAGRLRPAHRPVPRGGRLRRVRLAAGHARPAGRLAGAGRRRRSGSPTRWSPGSPSAAAGSATGRRSTGCSPPGAGRWGSAPSAGPPGGPVGRCSPTCPPPRSTWTWWAPRCCHPGWWRTWPTSAGTAPPSRSTGRCPRRCRGPTRRWPTPAPCTWAPTSTG